MTTPKKKGNKYYVKNYILFIALSLFTIYYFKKYFNSHRTTYNQKNLQLFKISTYNQQRQIKQALVLRLDRRLLNVYLLRC